MANVARTEPVVRPTARASQKPRREQIEGTLKQIDERQRKAKRPPLTVRLTQAGLDWSKRRFIITSVGFGLAAFLAALVAEPRAWWSLSPSPLGKSFGIPRWLLGFF